MTEESISECDVGSDGVEPTVVLTVVAVELVLRIVVVDGVTRHEHAELIWAALYPRARSFLAGTNTVLVTVTVTGLSMDQFWELCTSVVELTLG